MTAEIPIDRAQFLALIVAEANSDGQPLNELEKKCMSVALEGAVRQKEFAEIKKQFPSMESFDQFATRAARLVDRALLRGVEAQPGLNPHARAMMEGFLVGGGESVVEATISAAVFGRMSPALRALGITAVVLPLAVVIGWRLYANMNGGRLPSSSRSAVEVMLALVAAVAIWVVLNLLKKISDQ